ncbi:hypothetical protein E2C01_015687 [Portunus trituberculatus]|uniref:Uncharacterized protein n=1 Tax=Portunus trituberculatus TaxID=210409 RepID=A0A5B7DP26_PORTR|nr:hypothetical protein [Portunus trituberculatus]
MFTTQFRTQEVRESPGMGDFLGLQKTPVGIADLSVAVNRRFLSRRKQVMPWRLKGCNPSQDEQEFG